jgi:hypothetical protein
VNRGDRTTRAVLLAGVGVGVLVPAYFLAVAESAPLAWDFRAYVHAARLAVAGEPFVGASPPVGDGEFVYPPVTVGLFVPFARLDLAVGFAAQFLLQIACGLVAAAFCVRAAGPLARVDRALVGLFCVASVYPAVVLGQGQVDLALLAMLAGGTLALEADRETTAGALFGAAAAVKLFPAALGLWALRARAWRTVAGAVGVGTGSLLAGVAAFGLDAHLRYATFLLADRSRLEWFAGTPSPDASAMTLARPLSVLLPSLDPQWYVPVAVVLLAPALAASYRSMATRTDRLVALCATLVVTLLASPASNVHHALLVYFPLVPLLYRVDGAPGRLLHAGALVALVPVQPAILRGAAGVLGVTEAAALPLRAATALLTVGSPALWGLLLVLSGCVSFALGHGRRATIPSATGVDYGD